MASILVVDGDAPGRLAIARQLRELGHDVAESGTAGTALEAFRSVMPDLMLLECDLPDHPGMELLSDIKRSDLATPPRIVMTANGRRSARLVQAFESGADDFVAKPFEMDELVARIGACLRRPPMARARQDLRSGGIRIDGVGHRVFVDDELVSLAPREYRLLIFLLTNPERVFSRQQLLVHVWDRSATVGVRTVDVHIRRLRSLLEPFGYDGYIQTVRGSGYRFSAGAQRRS